jgi:hypothetical protein
MKRIDISPVVFRRGFGAPNTKTHVILLFVAASNSFKLVPVLERFLRQLRDEVVD